MIHWMEPFAPPSIPREPRQRTAWTRNLETPLRLFLRDQTFAAVAILAGIVVALIWANIGDSYEEVWRTAGTVAIGPHLRITQDLRTWINEGLMSLFFFTVGLEARREFDLGELRDRRRLMLPLTAGLAGMGASVLVFFLIAGKHITGGGWGVAMSTDTAFSLAMLAVAGRRFPLALRAFILTVQVVDDVVGLLVIALAFSTAIRAIALLTGFLALATGATLSTFGVRRDLVLVVTGVVAWVAFARSGVDPVVVGLVAGLLTTASGASREELEEVTDNYRRFREQPTSEFNRDARASLRAAISPNERWQLLLHPFTSYVVVPLFALANAGTVLSADILKTAFSSAITLGILAAYVIGKPIGIVLGSTAVVKATRGRVRPPVGLASVVGGGATAGVGFTVSLLIATKAFHGQPLTDAKLGILSTIVAAPLVTWMCQRVTALLPEDIRRRAVIGSAPVFVDLAVPVDHERDHVRGPEDAPVTIVEYGDLECPFCGMAEQALRPLLAEASGELRYVWRHLPLNDVHPHAQMAAEAAEAAADQGRFWELHDRLLSHQDELTPREIREHAEAIGLDIDRFVEFLHRHRGRPRVAEDVESADLSSVTGTPTFFVNGHRYQGAYDLETLKRVVRTASARAAVAQ